MSLKTYDRTWLVMTVLTVIIVFLADFVDRNTHYGNLVEWMLWIFLVGWIALSLISFWNTQDGEPGFESEE